MRKLEIEGRKGLGSDVDHESIVVSYDNDNRIYKVKEFHNISDGTQLSKTYNKLSNLWVEIEVESRIKDWDGSKKSFEYSAIEDLPANIKYLFESEPLLSGLNPSYRMNVKFD